MNVKREGNRGVTKLFYTIQRLQTTGHTYFVYIFSKRTNIGDNVYVATLCLLSHRKRTLVAFFSFFQFLLQLCQLCFKFSFLGFICRCHLLLRFFHGFSQHLFFFCCILYGLFVLTAGTFFFSHLLANAVLLFLCLCFQFTNNSTPF